MKQSDSVTTAQLSKLTGATLRMLQNWDEIGAIVPSRGRVRSRDDGRLYDRTDCACASVMMRMRRKGMSCQKAKSFLPRLRREISRAIKDNHAELFIVLYGLSFQSALNATQAGDIANGISGPVVIIAVAV